MAGSGIADNVLAGEASDFNRWRLFAVRPDDAAWDCRHWRMVQSRLQKVSIADDAHVGEPSDFKRRQLFGMRLNDAEWDRHGWRVVQRQF